MNFPSLSELKQLRRAFPLVSAVLFLGALAFPVWTIVITAPQYPGVELPIKLYAYPRLEGRVYEIVELNRYVGFYFPDPVYVNPNFEVNPMAIDVPEWILGPVVLGGFGLVSAAVALIPSKQRLKKGLKALVIGAPVVFLIMLADIQYRLYQAGHSLDPGAAVNVKGFTVPLLGPYDVANLSAFAWIGIGGYLVVLALVFLVIAYRLRNSESEISDVPELLINGIKTLRAKFPIA
jgi:hypothetical protein